jgi:hypothetical protein
VHGEGREHADQPFDVVVGHGGIVALAARTRSDHRHTTDIKELSDYWRVGLAAWGPRPLRCEVVDGPRGYQDDSDGGWYSGFTERHPEPEGRYDSDRYRAPEPRYSDEPSGDLGRYRDPRPDPLTDPALSTRPVGPRSGVELPPPLPGDPRYTTDPGMNQAPAYTEPGYAPEPAERAPRRRSSQGGAPSGMDPASGVPAGRPGPVPAMPTVATETVGGAIYRTRRLGVAAVLTIVALVAEVMILRVLLTGEFAKVVEPNAVLGGIFAMCGTPLVTMGLYGLMTGAVTAGGPYPGRAWLRAPLAYLPVGLALLIAAGLAA